MFLPEKICLVNRQIVPLVCNLQAQVMFTFAEEAFFIKTISNQIAFGFIFKKHPFTVDIAIVRIYAGQIIPDDKTNKV